MKRKEKEAMRNQTVEELQSKLAELRERQFKIGFQHKAVAISNPLEIRNLRRQAARIETWIREKRDEAAKPKGESR